MVDPGYETKELELYHTEYPDIAKIQWYRIINNELLLGRNKPMMSFNLPVNT